jgi:hypothetical protein
MSSQFSRTFVECWRVVLCFLKLSPMQRMIGTSAVVTGPSSFFTVAVSSVTSVSGSKMSLFATEITLAWSFVSSVVLPISKSSDGRIGSPRRTLPSIDSKRMRRFQDVGIAI